MTARANPYTGLSLEEWRKKIDKLEQAKRDKNWAEWWRIRRNARGSAVKG